MRSVAARSAGPRSAKPRGSRAFSLFLLDMEGRWKGRPVPSPVRAAPASSAQRQPRSCAAALLACPRGATARVTEDPAMSIRPLSLALALALALAAAAPGASQAAPAYETYFGGTAD